MSDNDRLVELETQLTQYFESEGRVSDQALATAQMLFDLRSIDDEVAALQTEMTVPARGDRAATKRFGADDVDIVASVSPGELMVIIAPLPDSAALESATDLVELDLDAAGGATVSIAGVMRIRVRREGRPDLVTEPLIVPQPAG